MKLEKQYFWKIQIFGKWKTTRFRCTEEHIKDEFPEAICIESSLIERLVPETDEEMVERLRVTSTGVLMNPGQFLPPKKPAPSADFMDSLSKDVPF
ncbi:hypothetical protein HS961_09150 [Comamonas piscis]|uniref:Uncharacterized protein n=1 Tax=Comamonas piscis TaxID=1562974 RepID=A0A7G5EG68_9BURK|nr:hypothetical protein [Comamonas piscis]QMV72993.1 hypothetical protein HS961_09150 [Comamonas piscis]WSO35776.1 hypothetical protein VUJ63_09175 [Comamonas piscis]